MFSSHSVADGDNQVLVCRKVGGRLCCAIAEVLDRTS